ncbi:MAG: hypothetical protein LBJ21_04645 [Acidobacteriota bacterium]|jgi:hypothetical protein|nr:hypothetical protein [Acidobacteriota bacterium]
MTAIGSILKSYFNPRRFVFWSLVLCAASAFIYFVDITVAARETGNMSAPVLLFYLFWPLFSFGFGILAPGLYLRHSLLEGEEVNMLPGYHARQLMAAIIAVTASLFVFLALTRSYGWLPLPALAGFLGITALTLWFGILFLGGFAILFFPAAIAAKFFPDSEAGKAAAESFMTAWTGIGAHRNMWSCVLIVLSLGAIILFCVRYLKIPCAAEIHNHFFMLGFGYTELISPSQAAQLKASLLERANFRADRAVKNIMFRMSAAGRGKQLSCFQSMRLMRLAMSRIHTSAYWNYGAAMRILTVAIFGALLTLLSFFTGPIFGVNAATTFGQPVTLFFACGGMAAMSAFNFQANKNQLPALYLQTDLPSKTAFLKTAAMGCLWSVAEPVLIFTGALLVTHVFFPSIAWPRMFQMVFIIAAMVLVQISVMLLTGNRRKTPPGFGWQFCFIMLYSPFMIIAQVLLRISQAGATWIAAGICVLISLLIFYAALRRWTKSEMDCQ